jgi:hypothetical protein
MVSSAYGSTTPNSSPPRCRRAANSRADARRFECLPRHDRAIKERKRDDSWRLGRRVATERPGSGRHLPVLFHVRGPGDRRESAALDDEE